MSGEEDAVAWLRREIKARAAKAQAALAGPWSIDRDPVRGLRIVNDVGLVVTWTPGFYERGDTDAAHIVSNDPRDTVARCEAELAILDEHSPGKGFDGEKFNGQICQICSTVNFIDGDLEGDPYPCQTVRLLASGYRHREGWAEHWGSE